jgi:hypothetical protein
MSFITSLISTMVKSILTYIVLRSCNKGAKFGPTIRVLCAVLPELDTLQGASANPHGHATKRPAGWHHNIAEFAAADCENHG